jgi:hypothetical protein
MFPFGAFARNGDILQVPFIGSYQIRFTVDQGFGGVGHQNFIEMNPVTMDCSFSDDSNRTASGEIDTTDTPGNSDDLYEHLGRFCPIFNNMVGAQMVDDYSTAGNYGALWRYRFATRLFDYLTVQSPASDYKPHEDPRVYGANGFVAGMNVVQNSDLPAANPAGVFNDLNPQAAGAAAANSENTLGVEGLVNINTAPWWVIASLPLVPANMQVGDTNNNGFDDRVESLAKQIVNWRDDPTGPHGPFRSIFDLNRVPAAAASPPTMPQAVPAFKDAITTWGGAADPDDLQGDVSPHNPVGVTPLPVDNARNDFEEQFMMLNRISNLITTRSDSYTVYIIVQGWRNAGTDKPELVVQRRAAMIIDRSRITGGTGGAEPIRIPVSTN